MQNYLKAILYLDRVGWGFGAPGHGKGPWDGIGGIVKNYILRRIIALDLPPQTAKQVMDMVDDHFGSDAYDIKHQKSKFKRFRNHLLNPDISLEKRNNMKQQKVSTLRAFDDKHGMHTIFYFDFLGDIDVRNNNQQLIAVRLLPCYCSFCMNLTRTQIRNGDISGCKSKEPWSFCTLTMKRTAAAIVAATENENNMADAETLEPLIIDENDEDAANHGNIPEIIVATEHVTFDNIVASARTGRIRSKKTLDGSTNVFDCCCGCGGVGSKEETHKCYSCQRKLLNDCYNKKWYCNHCVLLRNSNVVDATLP
jgi:hypothetical protein